MLSDNFFPTSVSILYSYYPCIDASRLNARDKVWTIHYAPSLAQRSTSEHRGGK